MRDGAVPAAADSCLHISNLELINWVAVKELNLGYRPPLSNSWILIIIWLYIALNRIPNIDCFWEGAVPKFNLSYCRGTM